MRQAVSGLAGHGDCELYCREHGAGIGEVFASDVEGSAMVGAGADGGEADCDVDGCIAREELDGDEPLIVVHGDDQVIFAIQGGEENRVCGKGAAGVDGFLLSCANRGGDDGIVFGAEESVFARVGIEAADCYAWRGDAKIAARLLSESDGGEDSGGRKCCRNLSKRDVDSYEDDFELWCGEEHSEIGDAELLGEELGVAGVVVACHMPGFFAYGGGDDTVDEIGMCAIEFGATDGFDAELEGGIAAGSS